MTDFDHLQALAVPAVPHLAPAALGLMKLADTLERVQAAAAKTNTEPTEAQKESGRYAKGKATWNGLTLVIENPKGSTRSGKSKDGTEWSIEMQDHYGYFGGKDSGADGDEVDFFLSEAHPDSEIVFVVNQVKKDGKFDEHKCVLGCITETEARETYLRNYSKGWTGLGSIKAMTLPDFKTWLDTNPEKAAAEKKETESEFWERNQASVERTKDSKMGHIRDGYIPCGGCGFRYHEMPEDETCYKCGGKLGVRLRSMKRPLSKSGFENSEPQLIFVKRAADDGHKFTICVDLDGTLAEKEEPFNPKTIGDPREEAVEWVRLFHEAGARIIIFTVRGDTKLVEGWLKQNDVPYDYVNENPDQPPNSSGKVFADVYWDDRAFNADDPNEHGPEILRRVQAHGGDDEHEEEPGHVVTITKQTVITISAPSLLEFMEVDDGEEGDKGDD